MVFRRNRRRRLGARILRLLGWRKSKTDTAEAFREFEGKFPEVRRDLIDANFTNWRSHLDFLLRYINMFRVRSKIYRSHVLKLLEEKPPMVIDQILDSQPHPTEPGKFIQKMTVKPMEQTGDELMTAFNDLSISKMRADMQEVPKLFSDLNGASCYTIDANEPVITCDEAIRFESPDPKLADPSRHLDTVLSFLSAGRLASSAGRTLRCRIRGFSAQTGCRS